MTDKGMTDGQTDLEFEIVFQIIPKYYKVISNISDIVEEDGMDDFYDESIKYCSEYKDQGKKFTYILVMQGRR